MRSATSPLCKQLISNHSFQYMKLERIDETRFELLLKVYPLFKEIRVNSRKKIKFEFFEAVLLNLLGHLAQPSSIHSVQAVIDNIIRCLNN